MTARLKILADRNIPYAKEAFSALGDVATLPSTELVAEAMRAVDVLLVRSTVKVNEALLGGSQVRFVATATIGTDHMDLPWLEERGIAWASAPGSNADSVGQWFASALLTLAERRGFAIDELTVGVIGVGNVGSRVARIADALGCAVLRCDPPRARAEAFTRTGTLGGLLEPPPGSAARQARGAGSTPEGEFHSLDALVPACDLLTFHVPLTHDGPDATLHLLDRTRLARLRGRAIVVNASRGAVVDNAALVEARKAGQVGAALFDVFEREPAVDAEVVAACDLATPHVAGHSLDGKANGTRMIYEALCSHLGVAARWTPRRALPPPPVRALAVDARGLTDEATALLVLRRFYRIENDDDALRHIARLPVTERGAAFQRYRASYPERRELHGLRVQLLPERPRAEALLTALGAEVVALD